MRRWLPVAALPALVAAALLLPGRPGFDGFAQAPRDAAERAEREIPAFGLTLGKLRSWQAESGGWRLAWQPTHGAWLVRAWVPSRPGAIAWRLDAAPWLPGSRLSPRAAGFVAGVLPAAPVNRERIGRRDWYLGGRRLLGSLPAGIDALPPEASTSHPPLALWWPALLAGCALAGLVARAVFPGVISPGWRGAALWTGLLLFFALPLAIPAVVRDLQPGVRPWVNELSVVASGVVLLGALMIAAVRFPAKSGRAPAELLPAALAGGLLAGRLEPTPAFADIAALPGALALGVLLAVVLAWLAGLAGEGLRELLESVHRVRLALLAAVLVAAAATAGPWLGPVAAVVAVAATERGRGTWAGAVTVAGWMAGGVFATCWWVGAQLSALALLAVGALVAVMPLLRNARTVAREASSSG